MPAPPSLKPEDLRGMNKKDYERAFRIFLSSFVTDMRRYLDTKPDTGDLDVILYGQETTGDSIVPIPSIDSCENKVLK